MAYALAFPPSVTALVYSLRDWRFEEVRRSNGTPTALAIKDLITIDANELRETEAIGNGEEFEENEIPEGYADGLCLTCFWWHSALEETHEEWGLDYPMHLEKFHTLQQHREEILRQFYFNAKL